MLRRASRSLVYFDDVLVAEGFVSVGALAVESAMAPEAGELHHFGQVAVYLAGEVLDGGADADRGPCLISRDFSDYLEAGTTASAWFPRVKPGEFRDVIFIEQAIDLGRFGVLTFPYPERRKY